VHGKKIRLFLVRESLVHDIPARDGKTGNIFFQCNILYLSSTPAKNRLAEFIPLHVDGVERLGTVRKK
jgi:hypothetical protein